VALDCDPASSFVTYRNTKECDVIQNSTATNVLQRRKQVASLCALMVNITIRKSIASFSPIVFLFIFQNLKFWACVTCELQISALYVTNKYISVVCLTENNISSCTAFREKISFICMHVKD